MRDIRPARTPQARAAGAARKPRSGADPVQRFRTMIYEYYKQNNRDDLPWRRTKDPYRILVSEIMLQQTQVERVRNKFPEFIKRFPDISALSRASLHSVLSAWQGLGYNRRALALKKIASEVNGRFSGKLPSSVEDLMALPGIGRATASAIAAFAFNEPVIFIETNIRRVFIHCFFRDRDDIADKQLLPFIERTLDKEDPRKWYYALMDYGAMLGRTTTNPNRKSRHYQRQSPFQGSDRQVRGMILRALMKGKYVKRAEILRHLNTETERADRILKQMEDEGFIEHTKKGVVIAEEEGN